MIGKEKQRTLSVELTSDRGRRGSDQARLITGVEPGEASLHAPKMRTAVEDAKTLRSQLRMAYIDGALHGSKLTVLSAIVRAAKEAFP